MEDNYTKFKEYLYSTDEPEEDKIREYILENRSIIVGYPEAMIDLVHIKQSDKYQAPQRLKLLVILFNLIPEFKNLEAIFHPEKKVSFHHIQSVCSQEIVKIFNRIDKEKKYSKYEHILNISYQKKIN